MNQKRNLPTTLNVHFKISNFTEIYSVGLKMKHGDG